MSWELGHRTSSISGDTRGSIGVESFTLHAPSSPLLLHITVATVTVSIKEKKEFVALQNGRARQAGR